MKLSPAIYYIAARLFAGIFCMQLPVAPASAAPVWKLLPPSLGVYHAAFPDFGPEEDIVTSKRLRSFVSDLAGKPIVWAYFSDNWFNGIRFPGAAVDRIRDSDALPFIRMMPRADWTEGCGDKTYSLQSIIDGRHDKALGRYARKAAEYAEPLMIEFGTEVNGNWFPWSGVCNGGGRTDGFGAADVADGPERFRSAYRHIIDIFRAEEALNVTWVLHLDAYSAPGSKWNSFAAYYPGADYIDWIGVSAYGAQSADELSTWNPPFTEVMDDVYPELVSVDPDKPIAVLEFGVVEYPGKDEWIGRALNAITSGRYAKIRAVSYWHSDWPNDGGSWSRMRLDSSQTALSAYRTGVSNSLFISEPRFTE
jgi:hypothetical protein